MGGTAGRGYNVPGGDPGVLGAKQSSLNSITSSTQGAQVGLGVSNPLTSVTVSVSPWSPPVVPVGSTATGFAYDTYGFVGVSLTQTLWNGYPGSFPGRRGQEPARPPGQGARRRVRKLGIVYRVKQAYYAMLRPSRISR